jgi:hypothetical protein
MAHSGAAMRAFETLAREDVGEGRILENRHVPARPLPPTVTTV